MKLRYKILLTILAAILYWLLVTCLQRTTLELPDSGHNPPQSQHLSSDGKELAELYNMVDENYFDGNLPKNVTFSYVLTNPVDNMAETTQNAGGFEISVAPRWMQSDMVKKLLMVHEACHVYADSRDQRNGVKSKLAHGNTWRACMLMMEMRGAFRDVLVYGSENRR